MPWRSPSLVLLRQMLKIYYPKLQEQVSRGVETLPRTACYLMSGSLFSLRVVLNAESGALRSQNTPGGYGSLAFSEEARYDGLG